MGFRKDVRTLIPFVRHWLRPFAPHDASPWEASLEDADIGAIRLSGALREVAGSKDLVLLVHGLGGGPDSYYCLRGAVIAGQLGCSSLALALRGADRRGEDFYNIALRADLEAAVASPALAGYERIFVIGYSMGGYVAMHFARSPQDSRVKAIAAVCTPLDLLAAQRYIDTKRPWFYRQHVLRGLKAIYAACAERGQDLPTDPAEVATVRTMYDWDRLAIAPRYGYDSPEHYYDELSILPHIHNLAIPAMLVAGSDDPIVPPRTILPYLGPDNGSSEHTSADGYSLEVRCVEKAGHVAFPRSLDLGFGPKLGLEPQVFQWFLSHI